MERILKERELIEKRIKIERYRRLNKFGRPGQILFAGSSLMEQFPIDELIMDLQLDYTIYNRGIGGFTTQEMLNAMDVCVYDLKPAYIYLNIGTNDMNGPDYEEATLIERYRQIINGIHEHLPEAKLTLLAYYPVKPSAAPNLHMAEIYKWRTNERIALANKAVEKLAEETGFGFVNVNKGITNEKGELRAEYTIDGMHMYGDGYYAVLAELLPHLQKTIR